MGLYLDPPERAVVFSFDEKSQIQALDRTQPGLPLKKGRAGTTSRLRDVLADAACQVVAAARDTSERPKA